MIDYVKEFLKAVLFASSMMAFIIIVMALVLWYSVTHFTI